MKGILLVSIILFCGFGLYAQVGITTIIPDASAALQVLSPSNNTGVLVPRLTADQIDAIAAPALGLLVFDTSNNVYKFFDGVAWLPVGTMSQTADPSVIGIKDGGDIYFNTNTLNINYYNGTAWMKFVKTGTAL